MAVPQISFESFAGRREELSMLRERFAVVRRGTGCAILLEGEAGSGKTRLIAELELVLTTKHRAFLRGTNVGSQQTPLAPFREAFGKYIPSGRIQSRLVSTAHERIRALAKSAGGMVLAIEDAQFADDATLELVALLARHAYEIPLMLLLTLGRGMFDIGAPLADRALRQFERIELSPLTRPDVQILTNEILRSHPDVAATTMKRIQDCCAGNPRYLADMLREAIADGEAGDASCERVPSDVRAEVDARQAMLSKPVRETLASAAVIGVRFEEALLASVMRKPAATVARALQRACELGFLTPVPGTAADYEFRHPLVREAVYLGIVPSLRRILHEAVAGLLERRPATAEGATEALSYHWSSAGQARRASRYTKRAAAAAERAGDYIKAAVLYERELALGPGPAKRAGLLGRMGLALHHAGAISHARPYLHAAAAYFTKTGKPRTAAMFFIALSTAHWYDGKACDALQTVERGLAQLDACGDSIVTDRLLLTAANLCDLLGKRQRSLDVLARIATNLPHKPAAVRLRYHHILAVCLAHEGAHAKAVVEFRKALAILAVAPDRDVRISVSQNLSACLRSAGDLAAAEAELARALDYARQTGAGAMFESNLSLLYADILAMRGRLQDAASVFESVAPPSHSFGWGRLVFAAFGIPIGLLTDRPDLVERCANEAAIEAAFSSNLSAMVGAVAAAFVRLHVARGHVRKARELLHRALGNLADVDLVENLLLEAAEIGEDADIARAREMLTQSRGALKTPYLALFDALVANRRGQARARQRLALEAVRGFENFGAKLPAARALELAGKQKLALASYRAIGAVRDARRLERVFAGRRSQVPNGTLTDRQREVGLLIASGQTNRAIARELHISRKTLEAHITAIYRRLGASSRTELAVRI